MQLGTPDITQTDARELLLRLRSKNGKCELGRLYATRNDRSTLDKAKQDSTSIFLFCLRRKREWAERMVSSLRNAYERRSMEETMGGKRGVEE